MAEDKDKKTLENIRNTSFWVVFALISYTSFNLFYSFADPNNPWEVGAFTAVALFLELFKIYCVVLGNTYSLMAFKVVKRNPDLNRQGVFKLFYRGTAITPDVESFRRDKKKSRIFYSAYILTAVLSVFGSFGWILQTVDYNLTQKETVVKVDSVKDLKQEQVTNLADQITQAKKKIASSEKLQLALDEKSPTYTQEYTSYQKEIDKQNGIIQTLLDKKGSKVDEVIEVSTTVKDTTKAERKSSYLLIAETTMIPEKVVMLFLLGLLGILMEVALFMTSPHFKSADEDDEAGEVANDLVEAPTPPPVKTRKPRTFKPKLEKVLEEVTKENLNIEPQTIAGVELESLPSALIDATPPFFDTVEETTEEPVRAEEKHPVRVIIEEPEAPAEVSPPESRKTEDKTSTKMATFVRALFNNGTKGHLKDSTTASREAGISLIDAQTYFNWLASNKGDTGYAFIEYRGSDWFPNYTAEFVIAFIEKSKNLPKN